MCCFAILRKHNPQIPSFYLLLQRGSSTKSLSSIDLIFRLDRYLEKTIRSAVEQHLFDVHGSSGQSSEDSESGTSSASSNVSARQRRRHHKEQEEARRNRDMYEPDFFVLESIFKSTPVMSSYQAVLCSVMKGTDLCPELKVPRRLLCLCRAPLHQLEMGN